jgi:hypothetical protein
MSPRVQLALYPDGDAEFEQHATLSLNIDVPAEYSAAEIVAAIQARLRETYPRAMIHSEVFDGDGFDARWHVYRDGVPAAH